MLDAVEPCHTAVAVSARAAGGLTEPSGSRWSCARCPSYLYSARKVAPLSFSCASASGMPSQILASIGFSGTPGDRPTAFSLTSRKVAQRCVR